MSNPLARSQWLWFTSRGSGLVLLVLFTAVVVLGVATRRGAAPRRSPRFVTAELHRTLSLFAVGLLALHVVTAIADPYVSIGWAATAVPFLSPYRTMAIGLGTLAVDLGRRGARHQRPAAPARAARLAGGALAGLPGLAGGVRARAARGRRPAHRLGRRHGLGIGGGRGRRAGRPPAARRQQDHFG